jgi:hypothetical protein
MWTAGYNRMTEHYVEVVKWWANEFLQTAAGKKFVHDIEASRKAKSKSPFLTPTRDSLLSYRGEQGIEWSKVVMEDFYSPLFQYFADDVITLTVYPGF